MASLKQSSTTLWEVEPEESLAYLTWVILILWEVLIGIGRKRILWLSSGNSGLNKFFCGRISKSF